MPLFIYPLRDNAVSKITLVSTQENIYPRRLNIQEPWTLFRLLDKSDIVAASTTSVDYKFTLSQMLGVFKLSNTLYSLIYLFFT
ncbi:type VI secretion IcmF C-terminal domain-containing protein [Vibrio diazotrophicus]|uniref:type VI secretion IcmF C-terminal domain-containing protein n=1 Tax=Vibrio diazotrophicus TaxID=685 RepID=UPI0034C5BB1B